MSVPTLLADAERRAVLAGGRLVARLAVCGSFAPARLAGHPDIEDVTRLLCEPLRSPEDRREYLLSEEPRVNALAALLARGGRAELRRARQEIDQPTTGPLQRMLDEFVVGPPRPLDERSEDELIASLTVWRWLTGAVALAGRSREIEVRPHRDEIEGRLAVLDLTRAVRRLAADGCVGRDVELSTLHAYRLAPAVGGLAADPALVVHGVGGVGKSTLIARFVMDMVDDPDGQYAWAYLDLDRPTLASLEPWVVLREVIRQVSVQLPEHLRLFQYLQASGDDRSRGAGLETESFYRDAAREFAEQLARTTGGRLVVVLDTFEQAERRPYTADKFYELFAVLAEKLSHFKLVVSGRAPARVFTDPSRPDRRLAVRPFAGRDAAELLAFLIDREADRAGLPRPEPDEAMSRQIAGVVGGIPLTMRLAARVVVREGPAGVTDAVRRASTLDEVRTEFVRGFLYQRILDHVAQGRQEHGAELASVARGCLILRWVTADLIEAVVLPEIGPAGQTGLRGWELFEMLAGEVALAERDGETLRLREELRGPALAALRYEEPGLVERLHRAAIAYFARSADPAARVELAYHKLAAETADVVISDLDESLLRDLEPSLTDLPAASARAIRERLDAGGDLSRERAQISWERLVLPEADGAIQAGDVERARRLLAQRAERTAFTPLHRLESRLHEADGDLVAAATSARQDMRAAELAADIPRYAAAAVRLAQLYERLDLTADAVQVLSTAESHDLVAGRPELRLELLLNRMNTGERREYDDEDTRWTLELDARVLVQRLQSRDGTLSSALVRLLAAALGREDPERLLDAAGRIGLGHDEDPARVDKLIRAIEDWDLKQKPPGALARACLPQVSTEPAARQWSFALSGTGTSSAAVLQDLWSLQRPPVPVREALRELYLWWGFRGTPVARSVTADPAPGFLVGGPIDWSAPAAHELEQVILAAYPSSTELLRIADRADLDPQSVSPVLKSRQPARDMLRVASEQRRVGDLVRAIFDDESATSVHPRLRAVVGDQWLADNGIAMQ